jgi:hypothetical protein
MRFPPAPWPGRRLRGRWSSCGGSYRGRAIGKDEVEKRGFPDAAPTKKAKQIESTERATRITENRIECILYAAHGRNP